LALNKVTHTEVFPGMIRQTHRKTKVTVKNGTYDIRLYHYARQRKKISALIPFYREHLLDVLST